MKILTPVGLVLVGLLVGIPCPAQDLPPSQSSATQAFLDTYLLGERLRRAREGADLDLEQKRLEVERQKLLLEQQQLQLPSLRDNSSSGTSNTPSSSADAELARKAVVLAIDVLLLEHADLADYGKRMDELAGLFAYGGKRGDFTDTYEYLAGLLTLAKAEESVSAAAKRVREEQRTVPSPEQSRSNCTVSGPLSYGCDDSAPESGCEEGHWIQSVMTGGEIVMLEDGSFWKIDSLDRIDTALWLPTEDVTICGNTISNRSSGDQVSGKRLK